MSTSATELPKIAYSVNEAFRASSLGRTTLYSHIAAGRLKDIRIGGRTVIPADSLRALPSQFPKGMGEARQTIAVQPANRHRITDREQGTSIQGGSVLFAGFPTRPPRHRAGLLPGR